MTKTGPEGGEAAITLVSRDIDQVESSICSALNRLAARIADFNAELAKENPAPGLQRWRQLQIALNSDADNLHLALMRLRAAAAGLETLIAPVAA